MAHKTIIGGTQYNVKKGKALVGGTEYSVKKGKTLIGGTVYEVGFGPATVTITVVGDGTLYEGDYYGEHAEANITHNGIMYETPATFEATVGDIIECYADANDDCEVYVNKSRVSWGDYSYVVTGDAIIRLCAGVDDGNWTYEAYVYINEIPSGGFVFNIGYGGLSDYDYVAEIGMTWAEWCNSEYSKINTGSSNMVGKYVIDGDTVKGYYSYSDGTSAGYTRYALALNGIPVKPTDVIIANAHYELIYV